MCLGSSPSMSKDAKKRELDYRAQDDHRTLTQAAEIAGDRQRMAGVKRHHAKTVKGMSKVGRMIGGKR